MANPESLSNPSFEDSRESQLYGLLARGTVFLTSNKASKKSVEKPHDIEIAIRNNDVKRIHELLAQGIVTRALHVRAVRLIQDLAKKPFEELNQIRQQLTDHAIENPSDTLLKVAELEKDINLKKQILKSLLLWNFELRISEENPKALENEVAAKNNIAAAKNIKKAYQNNLDQADKELNHLIQIKSQLDKTKPTHSIEKEELKSNKLSLAQKIETAKNNVKQLESSLAEAGYQVLAAKLNAKGAAIEAKRDRAADALALALLDASNIPNLNEYKICFSGGLLHAYKAMYLESSTTEFDIVEQDKDFSKTASNLEVNAPLLNQNELTKILNESKADVENKIELFKKIYQALRTGQTSLFAKTNFVAKLNGLSTQDQFLMILQHIRENPASRSAKAWALVFEPNKTQLFKEAYLYAFEKSTFYANSKLIPNMTLFSATNLKKTLQSYEIQEKDLEQADGNRRSSQMWNCLK